MTLTPQMFLIVCPLLFLGGLVDAIGGGGGLITLPAYMLAGVPVHQAIATNKLSSTCGTALATVRFIREGLVNWRLAVPTVLMAVIGSTLGANLSLAVSADIMEKVLVFVLPPAVPGRRQRAAPDEESVDGGHPQQSAGGFLRRVLRPRYRHLPHHRLYGAGRY